MRKEETRKKKTKDDRYVFNKSTELSTKKVRLYQWSKEWLVAEKSDEEYDI